MVIPKIAENRLTTNHFRKMFGNMASLLANDLITRLATFLLYALIARYLGAQEFGVLSLALTLIYTFQLLAPAGLRLLITREVTNDRSSTDRYLVNGVVIAVVFSLVSMVIIYFIATVLNYSAEITNAIFIVALGLIPFSISSIFEAIFQAWERMQFITIANAPRNIVMVTLAFLILLQGEGLEMLLWLLPITYLIMMMFEAWIIWRYISRPRFDPNFKFTVQIMRASLAFLGFQSILAVSNTLIFIYLSKFVDEIAVGYYNAATQVSSILFLVFQSIVLGAFPMLCQRYKDGLHSFKLLSDQLIEMLFTISIPMIIGLYYLAGPILLILYGNVEFLPAKYVLQVLTLTMSLRIFSSVLGRDLLAAGLEKKVLFIVLIDSVLNIVFGFLLIYYYNLIGAVIVAVLTTVFDLFLHQYQVSRIYTPVIPWRILWRATLAAGLMAAFLYYYNSINFFLLVALAGSIYLTAWILLSIWSEGGWKIFLTKLKLVWSS